MRYIRNAGRLHGGTHSKRSTRVVLNFAQGLHLAATPALALMALATGAVDGHTLGMSCSVIAAVPVMSGMVVMYLLMAVLHAGPWITLMASRIGRPVARQGAAE